MGSVRPKDERPSEAPDAGRLLAELGAARGQIEALEAELCQLRKRDPLTGLLNRAGLAALLERAMQRPVREDDCFALLVLDLDRFRIVNDTLGHEAGDKVLVQVADRLQTLVRRDDIVARISGDEFAVIARHLRRPQTLPSLARRAVARLSAPYSIDGQTVTVGVSAGIAVRSRAHKTPIELMQCADMALRAAKTNGRGRYQVFDQELSAAARAKAQMERDLRAALARREFFLTYQPRVEAKSGKAVAAEALLRWQHPRHGVILPADFIPIAEECGLIGDIGTWVLDHVCHQIQEWAGRGIRLPVSVNLSVAQFRSADVVALLAQMLGRTGISPDLLQVEITESMFMGAQPERVEALSELRRMGLKILIDDFGTGYSSLAYLHQFPVDKLKIDKCFVQRLSDPMRAALTQSIIGIGKNLHLKVVAEGVETRTQADFLVALGCDELQGFFFARPMRAAAFEAWLGAGETTEAKRNRG